MSTPFDRDGNPGSLTPAEVTEIEAVWQLVAEDFGPFNVDVTTEDPGTAALKFSGGGDAEYGTRIVISPTDAWFGDGYGGVAYVGSFKSNTPAFVFSDNLGSFKSVGDASSHESGHTLSLRHDGAPSKAYYGGHGEWGPIMGNSYRVRWPNGRRASTWAPTVRTRTIWRCSPRPSVTGSTITATPPRPRRRSPGPARHQASSAPTTPSTCSRSTCPPAISTPR